MNDKQITSLWLARKNAEGKERHHDHRNSYQRDRARILHSAAFRRLQAKTQVVGIGQSDFYRTRLTHSLEVAQIGAGIISHLSAYHPDLDRLLGFNETLIETLGLAHDIGHPPFGHGGEVALNYMMRDHGGFEGNGQTFRILTRLEPYTPLHGMNLTRRSLLGTLKYPVLHQQVVGHYPDQPSESFRQLKAHNWLPPKAIFDVDASALSWVLEPLSSQDITLLSSTRAIIDAKQPSPHQQSQYKSFDCSVMELADDIAYSVHDLEDAIVMGTVSYNQWRKDVVNVLSDLEHNPIEDEIDEITQKLFSTEQYLRKDAIGELVNILVTAIDIVKVDGFEEPLLAYNAKLSPDYFALLEILKRFVFNRVILKPEFQAMEYKGQQIVMELFEAFASDPLRLLPETTKGRWLDAQDKKDEVQMRIICDYISGMTDEYAAKLYHSLFTPKH
ncbi:anti-phage deoxyguanosine triphosphatase [Psychrobium sp. 1_MG-2023]|uniref:anti-phage deoxyguanosine triphosphatase n=1 Tax=Psychrobium sp. 1_MG-2023 TaxID=3062624 RepID=UPI000C3321E2|nr:anti-phage deoxyguanosine triphosphatase [Psychrobium sp. 1_MG-2023]MDP2562478.1 anti-phage deoxyguanosine triphosphatase [Psychrobium sp. 1_MG-2023]PKF54312.1 dGTPase [Alteromonadales bacterium alter-6D02]